MWESIIALIPPVGWVIGIPVIAALIIVLAIWGKVNIKWGKTQIGFGAPKQRSCRDCMVLTFSEREKFEVKRRQLENSILKSQMNFAEHKIEGFLFSLAQDYREHLKEKRNGTPDLEKEHQDCTLYEEILKQSLITVQNEVRRSFKENGFHELGGVEFQNYVKNKAQDLINRGKSYFMHRYPPTGMIITLDERLSRLNAAKIEDICFDVYVNAKESRVKIEREIDEMEKDFIGKIHQILQLKEEE